MEQRDNIKNSLQSLRKSLGRFEKLLDEIDVPDSLCDTEGNSEISYKSHDIFFQISKLIEKASNYIQPGVDMKEIINCSEQIKVRVHAALQAGLKVLNVDLSEGVVPENDLARDSISRMSKFSDKPENMRFFDIDNSYNIFVPKLERKYHTTINIPEQILKLQNQYKTDPEAHKKVDYKKSKFPHIVVPHPYEHELMKPEYPPHCFSKELTLYEVSDMKMTPLIVINELAQLQALASTLSRCTEFGVHLEQNDFRSFLGITCVMSISTRSADYIIDMLALRSEAQVLAAAFYNQNIIKIFYHGEAQVKWLQRDFGIYVVGMFDTFLAGKLLEVPQYYPLTLLLSKLYKIQLSSQKSIDDWRRRPISEEMQNNIREKSHYLPNIYDKLRELAIEKGKLLTPKQVLKVLEAVLHSSNSLCEKIYEKPVLRDSRYFRVVARSKLPPQKQAILRMLLRWRDWVARTVDESTLYVCNNEILITLANRVPYTRKALVKCLRNFRISPVFKQYSKDLLELMVKKLTKYGIIDKTKQNTDTTELSQKMGSKSEILLRKRREPEQQKQLIGLKIQNQI